MKSRPRNITLHQSAGDYVDWLAPKMTRSFSNTVSFIVLQMARADLQYQEECRREELIDDLYFSLFERLEETDDAKLRRICADEIDAMLRTIDKEQFFADETARKQISEDLHEILTRHLTQSKEQYE